MSMDAATISQSPTSARVSKQAVDGSPAEAAPRKDLRECQKGQALELEAPEETEASSGETSPIGLSLLYQKRVRQRESLAPQPAIVTDLLAGQQDENEGETSPIGKALLDRKRHHAKLRMARERGELADATGSLLNQPVEIGL
jgi:hypothetical protein